MVYKQAWSIKNYRYVGDVSWPHSTSSSVLWKLLGKIRLLELVLSNSENISCVAFLKHKNSRKQGTGTVASC
jgi:hypothetical protein